MAMRFLRTLPLSLLFAVLCAAQAQLPGTPAAHQFSAWLETFNRGDREALRDFLQKNYPSGLERLDRDSRRRYPSSQ